MHQQSKRTFSDVVRDIVRGIPRGTTMSYKEVAVQAGNPEAAHAVARIMASNYDLSIPCHRVIRSNGTLGGYNRGGETRKRILLQMEQYL